MLLLLPRLFSLLRENVWLEDDDYLDLGWQLALGRTPYSDVPLPHHCLLEVFLAGIFRLVGPSLRAAELCTGAAIWLASFLVYWLLRRTERPGTGVVAGLALGFAPLLFRYHIWEREVFSMLCFATVVVLLTASPLTRRKAGLASLVLAIAVAIKATNLVFLMAVVLHLVLSRQFRRAVEVLAISLTLSCALFVVAAMRFGPEFVQQVFLFHLTKGHGEGLGFRLARLYVCSSYLAVPGLLGLVALWRDRPAIGRITALWTGAYLIFHLLINPTFWPHNCIDLLPPLALGTAASISFVAHLPISGIARVACVLTLLLTLTASALHDWRLVMPAGDLRARAEIASQAMVVTACSSPEESITGRGVFPVAAARRNAIPYWEMRSQLPTVKRLWQERRWQSLFGNHPSPSFAEQARTLSETVLRELEVAIQRGEVGVVVVDRSCHAFPSVIPPEALLRRNGLRRVSSSMHYQVWARPRWCKLPFPQRTRGCSG